jgi:hypothetical protein
MNAPSARSPGSLPSWIAFVLVALPFVVAAWGLVAGLTDHWGWYALEDGPAENLKVVILLGATVVAAMVAHKSSAAGDRLIAALYGVLAVALFFVAGEEISWGQRLLGFHTPAEFAQRNLQGETTVHNLSLFTRLFHLGELAIGILGTALPLVRWPAALRARYGRLIERIVPPAVLIPYFALPGVWRAFRYLHPEPHPASWIARYPEVMELILYSGALLFVVLQLRSVRSTRRAPVLAATHAPLAKTG